MMIRTKSRNCGESAGISASLPSALAQWLGLYTEHPDVRHHNFTQSVASKNFPPFCFSSKTSQPISNFSKFSLFCIRSNLLTEPKIWLENFSVFVPKNDNKHLLANLRAGLTWGKPVSTNDTRFFFGGNDSIIHPPLLDSTVTDWPWWWATPMAPRRVPMEPAPVCRRWAVGSWRSLVGFFMGGVVFPIFLLGSNGVNGFSNFFGLHNLVK